MIKRQSCPVCKNELPDDLTYSPFCSERCQKVDLFRWFEGKYAVVDQLDPVEAQILAAEGELPLANDSDSTH